MALRHYLYIGLNLRALLVGAILLKRRDMCLKIRTISSWAHKYTYIIIIDSWSATVEPVLLGNTPFTPILTFSLEYLRYVFQRVMPSDDTERKSMDTSCADLHLVRRLHAFYVPRPPRVQCAEMRNKCCM